MAFSHRLDLHHLVGLYHIDSDPDEIPISHWTFDTGRYIYS